MTDEAKQARREYYRQYRKEHPEKARQAQARYWQRKAAELRSRNLAAGDPKQQNQD